MIKDTIKLVITDVDGVLTDNRIWVSNGGVEMWAFNQYDLESTEVLKRLGVEIIMLSGAYNGAFLERSDHMNVEYFRSADKLQFVMDKYGESVLAHTAFIGNDYIDMQLLGHVGYPACPRDAHDQVVTAVRQLGGYITEKKGGYGCFREWVDYLLLQY